MNRNQALGLLIAFLAGAGGTGVAVSQVEDLGIPFFDKIDTVEKITAIEGFALTQNISVYFLDTSVEQLGTPTDLRIHIWVNRKDITLVDLRNEIANKTGIVLGWDATHTVRHGEMEGDAEGHIIIRIYLAGSYMDGFVFEDDGVSYRCESIALEKEQIIELVRVVLTYRDEYVPTSGTAVPMP